MRIRKLLTILLTIAMVVSLLPATAFAANNTATTMRLAKTQGTVTVTNNTGKNVKQTGNMKLYNGYKVKTGAKSYAWISLDDTKVAKLDANSVMDVQKKGKSLTLYLSSGSMFFNVKDPLKSGETFSIKTSTMTTGIRGTSGCVRVISDRVTEIHLLTGQVEVYTEHPALGVSTSAVLTAGNKATSMIDWEAMQVSGKQAEILIERLENHEICGICSEEIAADPELLERIEREAPHLLPERAAAEAEERLAADEKAAEEKQAAIDEAIENQVFPEDVDPYFEEEKSSGGGGGGGSSAVDPASVRNVGTWAELLDALDDYNAGEGVTQINLTADIEAGANDEPLPEILDQGPLTLYLDQYTLTLNNTLTNNTELTINNAHGFIVGPGSDLPVVDNYNTLTVQDATIDGNGALGIQQSAGTLTVESGVTFVNCYNAIEGQAGMINLRNPAFEDITHTFVELNGATMNLYGITFAEEAMDIAYPITNNSGTLVMESGTIQTEGNFIYNNGTMRMKAGTIEAGGTAIYNSGTATLSGGTIIVENGAVGVESSGTLTMEEDIRVEVYEGVGIRAAGNVTLGADAYIRAYGNAQATYDNAQAVVLVDSETAGVNLTRPVKAFVAAATRSNVITPIDNYMVFAEVTDGNDGFYVLTDLYGQEETDDSIDTWAKFVAAVDAFNDTTGAQTIRLDAPITPSDEEAAAATLAAVGSAGKTSGTKNTALLTIDLNNNALTLPQTMTNEGNLKITGGTISSTKATTLIQNNGGTVELATGARVNLTASQTAVANANGTVNMTTGSTVQLNNVSSKGIFSDGGTVNMSGGEIIIVGATTGTGNRGIDAVNTAVTLSGGTIRETASMENNTNYGIYASGGTLNLTSGSITMNHGTAVGVNDVSGLTLGAANVTASVADNLLVTANGSETGYGAEETAAGSGVYKLVAVEETVSTTLYVATASEMANAFETIDRTENTYTIQMTADINMEPFYDAEAGMDVAYNLSAVSRGVTTTLDLNGRTLTLGSAITNNGNLTITDSSTGGSIQGNLNYLISNAGNLTWDYGNMVVSKANGVGLMNSGTATVGNGSQNNATIISLTASSTKAIQVTSGTVTVDGMQITTNATAGDTAILVDTGANLIVDAATIYVLTGNTGIENNGTAVLNGASLSANIGDTGTLVKNTGTLTMTDGTMVTNSGAAVDMSAGTFTMKGGSIRTTSYYYGAVRVTGGTADLQGGTITVNSNGGGEKGVTVAAAATLNMNGASIIVNGHSSNNSYKNYGIYSSGGTLNINSGMIKSVISTTVAETGAGNAYAVYTTTGTWDTLTMPNHAEEDRPAADICSTMEGEVYLMNPANDAYGYRYMQDEELYYLWNVN